MKFKPETGWAIYHRECGLLRRPVQDTKTICMDKFIADSGTCWSNLVDEGYTCQPVRVSVREIKKGKA